MADEQKPDPAGGTPERPEWLPERYDSPEQLAKAYAEAEKKITELSERAKQADALEENYNDLATRFEQFETQQRTQPQQNQASPLIQAYEDAYQNGDAARMLAINAEISRLAVQEGLANALPQVQQSLGTLAKSQAQEISALAARTLEQRYGDQWENAKEAMGDVLTANPFLIPEQAETDPQVAIAALENVFKIATHGVASAAAVDSNAAEQAKLAAQTATGAGTRVLGPDEQAQEWAAIRAAREKKYYE